MGKLLHNIFRLQAKCLLLKDVCTLEIRVRTK